MKKTLFTLACAALVAPAFAGEAITEPITITLPTSASAPTGWTKNAASSGISDLVNYYKTATDLGVYVGGNNNVDITNQGVNSEGSLTTSADNVASILLCGRAVAGGDNFAMVLSGEQLRGKVVNSLTLTGSGSSSNTMTLGGTFVVAVYNNNDLIASQTQTLDHVNNGNIVTCTLTLPNMTFSESNRIMIGFRGDPSSQANATKAYTISNIQLTAAPEPATATLSLLALAALAARRKRH